MKRALSFVCARCDSSQTVTLIQKLADGTRAVSGAYECEDCGYSEGPCLPLFDPTSEGHDDRGR